MRHLISRIPTTLVLGLTLICALAQADSAPLPTFGQIVDLHRQVIFITNQPTSNALAKEHNIFIARNYYYQKQHSLEEFEQTLLAELPVNGAQLSALFQYLHSPQVRAADTLAFIDVVDNLLIEHSLRPYLSTKQLSQLRQLEQQMLLVQETYKENLQQLANALGTRGFTLEPWSKYIEFLNEQYDINDIHQQFNGAEPHLETPATRGGESKKAKSNLVWGYGIPDKTVVLTFDDGPHYRNTGAILDTLKQYQAKAYFFAVGKNIGKINGDNVQLHSKAEQLQRALKEGHQLANHSFSHRVLTKLSADQQQAELNDTNKLLKAVSGSNPTNFRPPYGAKNDALVELSSEVGMRSIMWNIDSQDWADPIPGSIVKRVMGELAEKKKGILLFHDIHKQTVQALPLLLAQLKKEGYKVVDIDGQPFGAAKQTTPTVKAPAKSTLYAKSWALVIGVNKYQYWPNLSYAVNDAQGVAQVLMEEYGFEQERIFTLYDEQATRENITEYLADVLSDPNKIGANDRVFIFYAGHGMTRVLPSGRNLGYIIPVDAELDKFHSKSISMTHLQDFSEMIPAKHVYFVMDSCYSGIALTRSGGRVLQSKYLEEISSRQARQILTAGGADQEVADGGADGHSVFTWSLIKGLKGEADLDGNKIITASELGAFVSPLVADNSNQTPAFGNLVGSEGGEFLFEMATFNASNITETEEDKLKANILQLERENVALKQTIAQLRNELSGTLATAETEIKGLEQLTLRQRKTKADEYHAIGLKHYRAKNYQDALTALNTAMRYNPSNPGITNDYGFVLYRAEQYKDALLWLEKTIELDAKRIPVYLNIADTLDKLGKQKEAIPYYRYYLELYPDTPVLQRVNEFLTNNADG